MHSKRHRENSGIQGWRFSLLALQLSYTAPRARVFAYSTSLGILDLIELMRELHDIIL